MIERYRSKIGGEEVVNNADMGLFRGCGGYPCDTLVKEHHLPQVQPFEVTEVVADRQELDDLIVTISLRDLYDRATR